MRTPLIALDFFAGSGLVTLGLRPHFKVAWANDICAGKASVYRANFGSRDFQLGSIEQVHGADLPMADLSWASFPCQDLSLAGNMKGMAQGSRSGLFWQWLRVLDEIPEKPPVICLENVVGFLVADEGRHFRDAYGALRERGYVGGAFILDAVHFVPQSRPRGFLVAVREGACLDALSVPHPVAQYNPGSVMTAHAAAKDPHWIWWRLPPPPIRTSTFSDLLEENARIDAASDTKRLLAMLSDVNREKLEHAIASKVYLAGTGYKRMRKESSGKFQRLEIRFDGVAGCLRTPNGGSSRQLVIIVKDGAVSTRLLTVREAARLMGADDSFRIPGSYNGGYRAMGDAVAVPVTAWIAKHLLMPLAKRARASAAVSVLESV
jgi:DNA (cytosine-5)-methyltransferase 1